ncbi:MAG TPA: T9SS type A sorting domain-containing protein, partial [Candidatus Cloacimonadota bacterium]|nr:T9SS type A sorting domain-containing protein [Candidatus Cloacimonadota bacterium]
ESRLYIAIENNGGGFPTSQGFVFYSYIGVFSEPNNHDPNQTVFGLMYTVTQAGIISPGLYKITGTGLSDLVRIGGITIQTTSGTNILILSCLWSDLLADPDFNNWYVNSQSFGFMAMTQRITLTGGTVEADRTPGAVIYPVNEVYTPVINQIPVIYDPTPIAVLPDPYPGCLLAIRYQDENDDIPLQAKAIFDGIHEFDFIHMGESINGDMVFETSMDVTDIFFSNWHSLTYRFWYTNTDYVDTTVVNTGIHDPVTPLPALHCSIYPNPFAGDVNILVDNPKKQKVVISIFNIRGQCVKELYSGILEKGTTNLQWFNSHQFQATKASGVYFVGIKTDNLTLEKKIILVK